MRQRLLIVAALSLMGLLFAGGVSLLRSAPLFDDPPPPDPGLWLPPTAHSGRPVPLADGWQPALNVSDNSGRSGAPSLDVDRQGTVHLAWYDNSPGNWEILYATLPTTGTWTRAEDVSNNASYSQVPFLIAKPDGNVNIVWQDYGGPRGTAWQGTLLFKSREPTEDFGPPEAISVTTGFGGYPEVRDPHLAVDGQRTLHLVWAGNTAAGYRIFYARKPWGGVWTFPEVINNAPDRGASFHPRLAVDGADRLHVVWQETAVGAAQADIYYSMLSSDGTWQPPLNLSANSGQSQEPFLLVGYDGTLHVVWQDYTLDPNQADIFYSYKSPGGSWSPPVDVSQNEGDSSGPVLVEDGAATLHLVWYDNTPGNWEILYAVKPQGGSWTAAVNVSNTPGRSGQPSLVYDGRGRLHLAWADDTPGDFDIYYTSKTIPAFGTSLKQGPATALAGQDLVYGIVLRNSSTQAVSLTVTDSLPIELIYIEGSAESGGDIRVEGQTVQWSGSVPGRGEMRIRLRATVHTDVPVGRIIRNQAVIGEEGGSIITVEVATRVVQTRVVIPIVLRAH